MAETAVEIISKQQWLDTTIETVSKQGWLEQIAEPLRMAVHRAYEAGGETGRQLKNAMHGTWLGHPLHPALTDVPLGAWTTALVFDAAEGCTNNPAYARAADTAVAVGLVGAAGAALTGLTDWSETDGRARRVGLLHGLLNLTATSLYATSFFLRRNRARTAGQAYSLAGLLVATTAAYLGGGLVYRDRIGVTHADEGGPDQFKQVLASRELPANDKRAVKVEDTAIVVARQHDRVCALAEHCSHLGGPLSEGTLKDGSIVCPWHRSEFALEDGHVINGPATHPQPCFDARDRAGHIEVRARS